MDEGIYMEVDFITPGQVAERWGITTRQVQSLCKQGIIKDCVQIGRVWLIQKDAPKPPDGRTRVARLQAESMGR